MVDDVLVSAIPSRGGYDGDYDRRSHKREKKHKHKKHKSKDKKRSSAEAEIDASHKRRSKGYDSEPESGEIVTAEEHHAVEDISMSPSHQIVEHADIDSKPRVGIKAVGNVDVIVSPKPIGSSDEAAADGERNIARVQDASISDGSDAPGGSLIGFKSPAVEDGEALLNGSIVSGHVSIPPVPHTNGTIDHAVNAAVAADDELQARSKDEKHSEHSSGSEGADGVHAKRKDRKRRREADLNAHAKGSKSSRRSRSRSVDRSHHQIRGKREESTVHREKARYRNGYEDDMLDRHRGADGRYRDFDRHRRDRYRDSDRDRFGRDRDPHTREGLEGERDRRKRSRSRDGHRGAADGKRRRDADEQEPDAPVIAAVMTEEEEQRLIEERRKRRQQILARHQQQQAEAEAITAPTATALAQDKDDAKPSAATQEASSPQPAPPATPEQEQSTSGASDDREDGAVLDIFNHAPGEATSGPTPPVSEMPAAPPVAAPDPAEEVDDMFADDGDMFSDVPTTTKAPRKPAHAAGLADAYDDPEGYYNFQIGEVMDNRYEVYESKGKGVFSTVVRARDLVRQDSMGNHPEVAIKLIRANDTMYKAAQVEQMILKELAAADPDNRKHCIRLLRSFEYRNHMCLVFEPLDMNLRELTAKYGRGVGLNVKAVGLYASQLLMALRHLKKCNILHADIKPDNILVNKTRSKVKLCDFGSAMHSGENELTPYLVSRFYRPPEVILGLKYDFPMDMWSVGCVLYELVTGQILFPGKTNNDMLRLMMDVKGAFPRKMLKKSKFVDKHFDNDPNMSFAFFEEDPVTKAPVRRLVTNPTVKKNFEQLLLPKSVESDRPLMRQLADLMEKMMVLDPEKRIDPDSALRHPFVRDFATKKKAPAVESKK